MASKAVHTEQSGAAVLVTVAHSDRDSFTRSVQRAANKAWRALPYATRVRTSCTTASFAHTTTAGGECLSTVAYAPTFDAARDALGLPPL